MPKKRINNNLVTLKAIAAQYSVYGELADRIFLMHSEFHLEVRQVLEGICNSDTASRLLDKSLKKDLGENSTAVSKNKSPDTHFDSEDPYSADALSSIPESKVWVKKLFKKIAIHCHPDKVNALKGYSSIDKHKRLAAYEKARRAVDELDEPKIISVAADYDLVGDIGIDESKTILQCAIELLEKEVTEKQKSAVWAWGLSEDDYNVKAKVIQKFAFEIYGLSLSQEECKKIVCKFFNIPNNLINERKVGKHPGQRLGVRRKNE